MLLSVSDDMQNEHTIHSLHTHEVVYTNVHTNRAVTVLFSHPTFNKCGFSGFFCSFIYITFKLFFYFQLVLFCLFEFGSSTAATPT